MKWEDVSDADLNGALMAVKYGHDPVAAKNLIEYFYERIGNCGRFNERVLLELLNHAFGKIIEEDASADQAFGLKLGRGKYPREDKVIRDVMATAYMILLMRQGWTWEDAKGEAANLLCSSDAGDKAMEKAYADHKDLMKLFPDDTLKEMLPPGTPVISRDKVG
jgi:hypothetical protein